MFASGRLLPVKETQCAGQVHAITPESDIAKTHSVGGVCITW